MIFKLNYVFILRLRERERAGWAKRDGGKERFPSRVLIVSAEPNMGLEPPTVSS